MAAQTTNVLLAGLVMFFIMGGISYFIVWILRNRWLARSHRTVDFHIMQNGIEVDASPGLQVVDGEALLYVCSECFRPLFEVLHPDGRRPKFCRTKSCEKKDQQVNEKESELFALWLWHNKEYHGEILIPPDVLDEKGRKVQQTFFTEESQFYRDLDVDQRDLGNVDLSGLQCPICGERIIHKRWQRGTLLGKIPIPKMVGGPGCPTHGFITQEVYATILQQGKPQMRERFALINKGVRWNWSMTLSTKFLQYDDVPHRLVVAEGFVSIPGKLTTFSPRGGRT